MEIILLFLVVAVVPFCLASYSYENPAIYRPCDLGDYKCIGNILQCNSECKIPVEGYIPQELVIPEFYFETPYYNASHSERNLKVNNLNHCCVSEFYLNPLTDKAVLGIDCPNLVFEADRTLDVHRSLDEDAYCRFHFRGVYPPTRMTIVLPASRMDLREASIFPEVLGCPSFVIHGLDTPTANHMRSLNKPETNHVYSRESFYYRGVHFARRFVQSLLCDYGLAYGKGTNPIY